MAYLNFIRGGQQYLHDVSAAIAAVPNNRGCMSGPDLLPNSTALYAGKDSVYEVLIRHKGCRSNSAQNASYGVKDCGMDCIFKFAVRDTFGDFNQNSPHQRCLRELLPVLESSRRRELDRPRLDRCASGHCGVSLWARLAR